MSSSRGLRGRGLRGRPKLRPLNRVDESDDEYSVILPKKYGKAKEKILNIDQNDNHVGGLVERPRRRSSTRKPNYIDDSDDDSDYFSRKCGKSKDIIEKNDRSDPNVGALVEVPRGRSCKRRTNYIFDESDEDSDILPMICWKPEENNAKIDRTDAKENACRACGENGVLLSCETCNYCFHPSCILSPLKRPFPDNWRCPECVSPLNDIDKILDFEMRSAVAAEGDATKLESKHYLVKWKGLSYLHCTWVPEEEFLKAFKNHRGLKIKVNSFHRHRASANDRNEDFVAIRSEWTTVDRILASRGEGDKTEYLVKWKELPYDECYWELKSDISAFQTEIERFNTFQSRSRKVLPSKKISIKDGSESNKLQKEFPLFEYSPQFLSGGALHPYQLEGLNFLRFSWAKQTHVILADEMGLGKTIQSIAFLASLFEENVSPHLVVAPLSTLRNWEREFATWAPQMNVVMYFGSAKARAFIREYEFYFPKNEKRIKKKKSSHTVDRSKQERIKFDVLLTSYEMINSDTSLLKLIKWGCMIVDEAHRLKNKDSKLFSSLKNISCKHRVLLTGTPLQNNLDELFMLMQFLDAGKFGSLKEFQEEFKDINREEQILRLHKVLAPHLLRRMKKDVMTELPPKKELILRVELGSLQKEYYRAILTRNYQILTRKGGAQISLMNVVMELRKLCCHPYMLQGVKPDLNNREESYKRLLESSGKLLLLDKMMIKLKEQGHRVLIYSQFQGMLDLLEDYCFYKQWMYERIDGKVGGAERQVRIDRFNAKDSSRFCFLLSTRAGGLGINLTTADTVIIFDSDWNPHADLQAMARAHRLGQSKKVMIYRLITRGTIEEKMMQMAKKKMVLEHLVVGRLKAQNLKQEELDDIVRYGSEELFAEENDEVSKSRQIHYDDNAIDRLLDRDQVEDQEAALSAEEEDGFFKAFKVANFEYIEEVEPAEEVAENREKENQSSAASLKGTNYWEELLRGRYEEHKVEELIALGKGKRKRTKLLTDGCSGLEDISSSDSEDENYEVDLTEDDSNSTETIPTRRPYKKKAHDKTKPLPLMEGEGKSLKVLGFSQNQRATFVQILMSYRFGIGDYDWKEIASRMKQKSYEEIDTYAKLFLSHLLEDINDSPKFTDGVPKDFQMEDVLVRIALLVLIREKVKFASENPGARLFSDDILLRYAGLKGEKIWKQEHDLMLLQAVLKHGYARWNDIIEDNDLEIQKVICQELSIPFFSLPVKKRFGYLAHNNANMTNMESSCNPSGENVRSHIAADGANMTNVQSRSNESPNKVRCAITFEREKGFQGGHEEDLYQSSMILNYFKVIQRRQIGFITKRLHLLEKGLNAEYQKEYSSRLEANEVENEELRGEPSHIVGETDNQAINHLPQLKGIGTGEFGISSYNFDHDRLQLAGLYNEMCKTIDLVHTSLATEQREVEVIENLGKLETISADVKRLLNKRKRSPQKFKNKIPNAN